MPRKPLLLRLLLATFAGFVNRQQDQVIQFLREENRVLKEQLGSHRPWLTEDQRRRLAAKGRPLGRSLLAKVATIVTPDTILRWYHTLIAAKFTSERKGVGRPGLMKAIRDLIVCIAKDNASWGDCRIQGELHKLGHMVSKTTIGSTLKKAGVPPSPSRPTSWRTFLKAHAPAIMATDFFTVEAWTARGLVTHYVLFVIHHATRAVHIAGITTNPNAEFMAQVARNLTDHVDGFLRDAKWLILDRDTKFTEQFRRILDEAGVGVVTTAFQAPNMNAIAERFVGSIKRECLSKLILFGEDHLRRAIREFVEHYHEERPHQGLGNRRIRDRGEEPLGGDGEVVADERLGGLLRSYRRSA